MPHFKNWTNGTQNYIYICYSQITKAMSDQIVSNCFIVCVNYSKWETAQWMDQNCLSYTYVGLSLGFKNNQFGLDKSCMLNFKWNLLVWHIFNSNLIKIFCNNKSQKEMYRASKPHGSCKDYTEYENLMKNAFLGDIETVGYSVPVSSCWASFIVISIYKLKYIFEFVGDRSLRSGRASCHADMLESV